MFQENLQDIFPESPICASGNREIFCISCGPSNSIYSCKLQGKIRIFRLAVVYAGSGYTTAATIQTFFFWNRIQIFKKPYFFYNLTTDLVCESLHICETGAPPYINRVGFSSQQGLPKMDSRILQKEIKQGCRTNNTIDYTPSLRRWPRAVQVGYIYQNNQKKHCLQKARLLLKSSALTWYNSQVK